MANSTESIDPISYSQFSSLLGALAASHAADPGCAWYMTSDRLGVASLHLDSSAEKWRFVTYSWKRRDWKRRGSALYDSLEVAQQALVAELRSLSAPPITTIPKPFRLRFGRKPR